MNDYENRKKDNDEIDLVDFSANREMDRIRENERIERERRMKRAAQIRRQELLKQRKKQRIQQMIFAWGVIILVIAGIVASIIGIVSLFSDDETKQSSQTGDAVSKYETDLISAFENSTGVVYSKDKNNPYAKLVNDIVIKTASQENVFTTNGELYLYADAFLWNSGFGEIEQLKSAVKDVPIFNNGYVWTTQSPAGKSKPMGDARTGGYFYDTNASFIKAVSEICLWEASTSFLGEMDANSNGDKRDFSAGKNVGEKLKLALNHLFDTSDNSGVKYNDKDGLVYIRTPENNGKTGGHASNIFFTYSFGHLDCYNNLLFYDAMTSLSKMYEMVGDEENCKKYSDIAKKNKDAINRTFYDSSKGRYVGYIDSQDRCRDYGFTAINLMAVSLGVADKAKSEKILSWVDTEARAESGVFPSFTTVAADDTVWNTYGKYTTSETAKFREFWLNGARSAFSGYCYVSALEQTDAPSFVKYLDRVEKSGLSISLPSQNDNSEPELYYALFASSLIKNVFGITAENDILGISPVFGLSRNMGVKDIAYKGRNYDVLVDNEKVYVLSDVSSKTKLRIGAFGKNEKVNVTVVKEGKILSEKQVRADENGNVLLNESFGDKSYVRLERVNQEQ